MSWSRVSGLKREELEARKRGRSEADLRAQVRDIPKPRAVIPWLRPEEPAPAEGDPSAGNTGASAAGTSTASGTPPSGTPPRGATTSGLTTTASGLLVLPPSSPSIDFGATSPFSLEALIAAELSSKPMDNPTPPVLPLIPELKRRAVPPLEPHPPRDPRIVPAPAVFKPVLETHPRVVAVWTDLFSYGGGPEDLAAIRQWALERREEHEEPGILRADLFIDPYQVFETVVLGGDAILVTVAAVSRTQLEDLVGWAGEVGLEVLCYLEQANDMGRAIRAGARHFAIGQGDLFFQPDREAAGRGHLRELARDLPRGAVKLSWGGIRSLEEVDARAWAGASALLAGRGYLELREALRRRAEEG